jgi:hypothetical protein
LFCDLNLFMYRRPNGITDKAVDVAFNTSCHVVATGLEVTTRVMTLFEELRMSGIKKDLGTIAGIYGECARFVVDSMGDKWNGMVRSSDGGPIVNSDFEDYQLDAAE